MNPYDSPAVGTSVPLKRKSQMPGWFLTAMSGSACVALVASVGMVLWSAETEPFFGPFKLHDALISLVGGGVAFLFWIVWSGSLVFAVRRRWIPTVALALILLALFALLLNWMVVFDYLGDRQSWLESRPS